MKISFRDIFLRNKLVNWIKTYPISSSFILLFIGIIYWRSLPYPLFKKPLSVVLEDREGQLLGARIAKDGQWRFPAVDSLPQKYIQALIEFEDRRFYYHPGVDLPALGRAIYLNLKFGRIVSGGSTLSMQVIRMAKNNPPRTIWQKCIEIILATRLELGYSKDTILKYYASNAPFGGNVVGIEAATWRYFAKRPHFISWSEAALLAVLPNSPSLIHPGRNRQRLLEKRNRLLDQLYKSGKVDSLTCELAKLEPLPNKVHALPQIAPHLLDRVFLNKQSEKHNEARVRTTIDASLQHQVNQIVEKNHRKLVFNQIHNIAVLVVDVESKDVLAYVGNASNAGIDHGQHVDIIKAPRSTGSLLKPFLYAQMINEGELLPTSLVSDVPTQLSGYRPENYHEKYDGLVSAKRALVRSLNVPFVQMLSDFGVEKFHFLLQKLNFSYINQPAKHYGLPLVLGGAECSLWEAVQAYAGMAKTLNNFYQFDGQYQDADFNPISFLLSKEKSTDLPLRRDPSFFSASAIWYTFEAMKNLERPNQEGDWRRFASGQSIAWKTGTSFGFRDAWAVGISSKYVVGIWVGNADGEGRPGLVGVKAAAPVLFDVFDRLPSANWFDEPIDEMVPITICAKSGFQASSICPKDTLMGHPAGLKTKLCPYHKIIHLDASEQYQVHATCEPIDLIKPTPWFILPPLEAYYYQSNHPEFALPPPIRADCKSTILSVDRPMQLIYPKYPTQIYVPIDLDGQPSRTVFSVAHQNPEATIHWHIDEYYMGSTKVFHNMELNPIQGSHQLTLVDGDGRRLELDFEIIGKE